MAAVRYRSEFRSHGTNDLYHIEILDAEGSAGAVPFTTTERGFTISLRGDSDDLAATILGTECSVDMYIEDATHEELITDLRASQEGRFFIRILKWNIQEWVGVVLPDIGTWDEDPYPYLIKIRATDGLGALKGKPFWDDDAEEAYEGKENLLGGIIKCLTKVRHVVDPGDFFSNSDVLIRSMVDWWETNMSNDGSGPDALSLTYHDHSVWYKWKDLEKQYQNCYDVLKHILTIMGARITFYQGAFWIEQITYRTASTVVQRRYTRTGALLSTLNYTSDKTINQTIPGALLFGAQYEMLPTIRDHRHTFLSFTRRNFFAGLQPKAVMGNVAQYFSLPLNANSGKTTLRLTGNIKIKISSKFPDNTGASAFQPFFCVFNLQLFLKTKGLRRTYTATPTYQILYSPVEWNDSPGFPVVIPIVSGPLLSNRYTDAYTFSQDIDIFTRPLPESTENFTFFWELTQFQRFDGGGQYSLLDFNIEYDMSDAWLEAYSEGGPVREEDEIVYEAIVDKKNSVRTESECLLGTSGDPNTLGALWVKLTPTTYTLATYWSEGLDPRTMAIETLLTGLIASGRSLPVRRLNGTMYGDFGTLRKLLWVGAQWIVWGGEWSAGTNEFSGEWVELVYLPGLSVSPPKKRALPDTPVPDPPVEGGDGGEQMFQINELPVGTHFYPLSEIGTDRGYEPGSISTLHLASALAAKDYRNGEEIALMNPATGYYDWLTVSADAVEGATTLSVVGTIRYHMPPNSPVLRKPRVGVSKTIIIKQLLDGLPFYTSDEDAVADGLGVGDWYICDEGHTGSQPGTLKRVMSVILP